MKFDILSFYLGCLHFTCWPQLSWWSCFQDVVFPQVLRKIDSVELKILDGLVRFFKNNQTDFRFPAHRYCILKTEMICCRDAVRTGYVRYLQYHVWMVVTSTCCWSSSTLFRHWVTAPRRRRSSRLWPSTRHDRYCHVHLYDKVTNAT